MGISEPEPGLFSGCGFVGGRSFGCYQMSKLEDPEIKVKLAMVATTYPGASAHQVELEVTDVLEKAIRSMGDLDHVPLVRWMTCRRLW